MADPKWTVPRNDSGRYFDLYLDAFDETYFLTFLIFANPIRGIIISLIVKIVQVDFGSIHIWGL